MSPLLFIRLLTALVVISITSLLRADLVVDVLDASIESKGTGSVEVRISSTSVDPISLFGYEFKITSMAGAVGDLRFTNPQILTEQAVADYVFFGDTDSFAISSDPQNSPAFDSIVGGDGTFSGDDVTINVATVLLARLDIEHVLPGATSADVADGSQWAISLRNTIDTFFEDSNFNPVDIQASSFGAVGSGTITVFAATIPEPSSTIMLTASFIIFACRKTRHHGSIKG